MTTATLTNRQQEILDFMHEHFESNRVYPTVREIAHAFGINSPNGVTCHLKALEKKGFVRRRSIGAGHNWQPIQRVIYCDCPHCGEAIEVTEDLTN